MAVDLTSVSALVAATLAGISTGAVEGLGDRAVSGTLDFVRRSRTSRARTARDALRDARNSSGDQQAIASLAAALEALARSNPDFRRQILRDFKELQANSITINASAGSNVYVGHTETGQRVNDEATDDGLKPDRELSPEIKALPFETYRIVSLGWTKIRGNLVSRLPDDPVEGKFKYFATRPIIPVVHVIYVTVAILPVILIILAQNAIFKRDGQSAVAAGILVLIGAIGVPLALSILNSSSTAAAPTATACGMRLTAIGSGEITTHRLESYENYQLKVHTSLGDIVLTIEADIAPCEAFALKQAIESGSSMKAACLRLDGALISCFPESPTNRMKIFKTHTKGETPTAVSPPNPEGTVLLRIDDDTAWVTGLMAFIGGTDDATTYYDGSFVAVGTVDSGLNLLNSVVDADSYKESLFSPSMANKPFTIKAVELVRPSATPTLTMTPNPTTIS